ncbi:MAG: alkaline phosphatase [Burkholderiales bacterium]
MGITTITAARILEGQMRGKSGEENLLSFETLPYVALSKTYSVNQQTPDSAPTMSAMMTGVKTNDGLISVNENVARGNYRTVNGNQMMTILERAEERGMSTGVVTTARLTHATPAACYAHTAERDWESDADQPAEANRAGFADIARQLIEFRYGDGLEVAMGGGRAKFLPRTIADPEDPGSKGERNDGRDLIREWMDKYPDSAYVWDKAQFDAIDLARTRHLLGLFERSHMHFEYDRNKDRAGEPSLTEMTVKAIDILSRNPKGYFLMVEGGRIDHAHHAGNAFRALSETIELSNAVRAALQKIDLRNTLVIVTADHSHAFTLAGYPARGNNILGLVKEPGAADFARDRNGRPYTTLGYANGPGYRGTKDRPELSQAIATDPDFLQEATVGLGWETHGGEDVAIYAGGAQAHLIHGVMEQHVIYHVMSEALGFDGELRQGDH